MSSDKENILFSGIIFRCGVFVRTFNDKDHEDDEKVADNDTVS